MIRFLLLALALAPLASAQSLADADARFRADLETVARVAATAALVHDQTGTFPATPFELLGSAAAGATGLRATPLSTVSVEPAEGGVRVRYNPLPRPYVSDDLLADVVVTRDADGRYTARHELRRRADPDRGGRALAYDLADGYRVEGAQGTLCVDLGVVREALGADRFAQILPDLGGDGVPVQVRTLDGADRIVYTSGGAAADA